MVTKAFGVAVDPVALAVTLGVGALGGVIGHALGLPLGLLLGALVAVGTMAASGTRIAGHGVHLPQPLRFFFVPVIGVAIGGAFTPAVLAEMPGWWPSLLALCLYIPLAHFAGFWLYRQGGLDRATAWFGATPGGLIDSVLLGEAAGADEQMLVLLQFLRLILTVVAVPVGFMVLTGHAVGSAGGARIGVGSALLWGDLALLAIAAVAGVWLGRKIRLPAAIMTGPVALSAAFHLAGWTEGVPPDWMVGVTQVVVGSALGARFAGLPKGAFRRAATLASANVAVALVLASGFALVLPQVVAVPVTGVFLAFAPGGLAEMSLVALSLQVSVVFVTAHHVLRIGLSVLLAQALWKRMIGPGAASG